MLGRLIAILAFLSLAACRASAEDGTPDTVGAWVTGTQFAYGANRDRDPANPPPELVAEFKLADGSVTNFFVGRVVWKGRHYVQRRLASEEAALVRSAEFRGVVLRGGTEADRDVAISDARFFRDPVTVAANCGTPRDYPLELPEKPSVVRRIRVPYLPYGEVELLEDGNFRYAYFDWEASSASEIVFDGKTARPVARYYPKLDGTYNAYSERPVVKVSKCFEDVLPELHNPTSEWKRVTGTHVWRTHAAFDRPRDKALWRFVHDHGIREVCVMDHETMWRDGGEPFTMVSTAAKGKGGDGTERKFSDFMNRELGYWYGPYNNYTDYQPDNTRFWDVDRVTRTWDGQLREAWLRSYTPKSTRVLDICRTVVPEAQAKFRFRGAYCDVHTAVKPWTRTDYDPREPGAGMFRTVVDAYRRILLEQKRLWEGPVWSEGGCHFLYEGYADGNYARDYEYGFHDGPWLVDFDLLRLHPLACDFGMGSLFHFSPPKTKAERDYYLPSMPEGREAFLDLFIGATLAFGHAGYLVLDWCWSPMKMFGLAYCGGGTECFEDGILPAMKSYFMTQAAAARYTQSTAEEIRYFDGKGAALDVSAAIRTGALARRQIHVRYADGTHVLVNGNCAERLVVSVGGRRFDLPPRGYRVWTEDGAVEVESGDSGGKGPRTDFARGPDYEYRGVPGVRATVTFRENDGTHKTVVDEPGVVWAVN